METAFGMPTLLHVRSLDNNVALAVDALVPLLKQSGITLCFENTGNFGDPHVQSLVTSFVERDQVGVTWDFGHDAASGFAEKDYLLGLGYARSHGVDVVIETKDLPSLRNSVRKLRERNEL